MKQDNMQGFIVEAGLPTAGAAVNRTVRKVTEEAPNTGAAAALLTRAEAFVQLATAQIGTVLPDGRPVARITFTGPTGKAVQFADAEQCAGFLSLLRAVLKSMKPSALNWRIAFEQFPDGQGEGFKAVAVQKERHRAPRIAKSHAYVRQFAS